MAPVPPTRERHSVRSLRQARIAGELPALTPSKAFRPAAAVSDSFLSTKRDKRLIKRSAFLSRFSSAAVSKPARRRRRRHPSPSRLAKLDLGAMADALPALPTADNSHGKSLGSRRGALKKKERLVKGEMARFGANMVTLARLQGAQGRTPLAESEAAHAAEQDVDSEAEQDDRTNGENADTDAPVAHSSSQPPSTTRWDVLRGYIAATMEQNPAFRAGT